MAAPSRTPLTGPEPRTPSSATIDTKNSVRLKCQMCRRAATSTRLITAASTMAASTGCGRFRSRPEANSTTTSVKTAATSPDSGVRAPALSLTSDCDMPPLTGNPRPSPATQIAGAERQELLVGIEPVAVLLREHPADGRRLDGAEDEAGERQRQEVVELVPADERQSERRQPLRNLPEQRDARGLEIQQPRGDNAGDDDEKGDRPVLQPELAGDEHRAGAAPPTSSDAGCVSPRWPMKCAERSQKSPCVPLKPNSFGSCVLAR